MACLEDGFTELRSVTDLAKWLDVPEAELREWLGTAPTSPAISNLVCRKLDERLSGLVNRYQGQYTRYADDITISLAGLGRNKRLRPHQRQTATGLVVNRAATLRPGPTVAV